MKKLPLTALILASCAHVQQPLPEEQELTEKIHAEERNIKVTSHKGATDYKVILIKDVHATGMGFSCQMDIMQTLEFLDPKVLAREGRYGLVESDNERWYGDKHGLMRNRFKNDPGKNVSIMSYKAFVELPYEKRMEWRNYFMASGAHYPVYDYGYAPNDDVPLMADALYEAVYQERVLTLGTEDKKLNSDATKIAMRGWRGPLAKHVVLDKREISWVRHITNMGESTGEDIVMQAGFMHFPKIENRFAKEGVSYVVITHEDCNINGYKL